MLVSKIDINEYDPYYGAYINKVSPNLDLGEELKNALVKTISFFKEIPDNKLEYRYAKDKWTIKELFQHIIDAERVFFYRAFRIARHDTTPIEGFDENIYIKPSGANNKSLEQLIGEYKCARNNTITLFSSLTNLDLEFLGTANDSTISARAIFAIILGHEAWHLDVIKERYLN